jgi:hypothetical protein
MSETNPDVCPDKQGGGDYCYPGAPEGDICLGSDEYDSCVTFGSYNSDICPEPGGRSDQDYCDPTVNPDICSPSWDPDVCNGDQDSPNAVSLRTLGARRAGVTLPVLGGAVVALGAAAAWLRNRRGAEDDAA